MVHFGPNPVPDTTAGEIYEISHGRAAILFVLLAGIGISFLYRSAGRSNPALGTAQILIRAAILLPIGLWLQTLDHGVLVILQFYALYFAFAAIVVRASSWIVLAIAIGFLALGPVAYEAAELRWPAWYAHRAPELGDSPGKIARDLFVSGYYPLVTWAAPLTLGIWLGRQKLSSMPVRIAMIGVGLALVVGTSLISRLAGSASNEMLGVALSNEPHSQTHLWMIGAIGSSLLVLGTMLVVAEFGRRIVWPLAAAGQLALTIYIGHLLLLDRYTDILRHNAIRDATISVGLFMVLAITASVLWRLVFSHGPLEALFRLPTWLMTRSARRSG